MEQEDTDGNARVKSGKTYNDSLDLKSIDSGLKHPDKCPEPWNICRDFIDPLAGELEKWLRKTECTIEDIETLQWFEVGWNGAGTDDAVGAWYMAKEWFSLK